MKIIKTYEEWSPKFNKTLQSASALATSTNKGFGKATKSIEDYANRSISKEEFRILVPLKDGNNRILKIVHDPKFILKPMEQLALINKHLRLPLLDQDNRFFSIPVIAKGLENEDGTDLENEDGTKYKYEDESLMITFDYSGNVYITKRLEKWNGNKNTVLRFLDRASIENFIAMAIQAITSSPEPGTPVESGADIMRNIRSNKPRYSGMTKEKQDILNLIQKIVLDKDMRSFTM